MSGRIADAPWLALDTERQVEVPWLWQHLALRPDRPVARLLDVGGADACYLPALQGHARQVVVLDPRAVPLPPGIVGLVGALGTAAGLPPGLAPFPVVTCISVLDHIGLDAYGQPADSAQLPAAVHDLTRLVAPRGSLYLTVPTGADTFTTHPGGGQRVFSRAALGHLFPDTAWRWTDERCWRLAPTAGQPDCYLPTDPASCDALGYAGHRAQAVRGLHLIRLAA